MAVTVAGRKMTVTDALRQYADEKCRLPQKKTYFSDTHFVRCCAYDRPGFHIEREEKS